MLFTFQGVSSHIKDSKLSACISTLKREQHTKKK